MTDPTHQALAESDVLPVVAWVITDFTNSGDIWSLSCQAKRPSSDPRWQALTLREAPQSALDALRAECERLRGELVAMHSARNAAEEHFAARTEPAVSGAEVAPERCPHGVRNPHPCRECEDGAPEAFVHDATERAVICKHMRRVARAAGVESAMPEDDMLYACIGTLLGTVASALERAGFAPLPLMRAAFRTTETMGIPELLYRMIFEFPSIADLHAADAEWVNMTDPRRVPAPVNHPAEPVRLLAPQPAPTRDAVPGKVHCAKCGFTLQRVNLYMLSGTTGAGGEQTGPCPNDGTPMLPVTWEQEAREGWKMAEQQFDRIHALEAAGAELVACKDLKDEESHLRLRRDVALARDLEAMERVNAMRADYNRRKPLAWAAMRALLPKIDHT